MTFSGADERMVTLEEARAEEEASEALAEKLREAGAKSIAGPKVCLRTVLVEYMSQRSQIVSILPERPSAFHTDITTSSYNMRLLKEETRPHHLSAMIHVCSRHHVGPQDHACLSNA
jgi:hypothetical protein